MLLDFVSPLTLAAVFAVAALVALTNYLLAKRQTSTPVEHDNLEHAIHIDPVDPSFDWETEPPHPFRPYKAGPYTMTLGLKNIAHNDLLLLDNEYLTLTDEKQRLTREHIANTVLMSPVAEDAMCELYELCINIMKNRYPMYFIPVAGKHSLPAAAPEPPRVKYSLLYNAIRKEYVPFNPYEFVTQASSEKSPHVLLLEALAQTITEDFLIMMHDDGTQQYHLRGGSFTAPSGFDPAIKMNMPLREIHRPVPYYKAKIESPMDKFFARIRPGKWAQRVNWTIQTHTHLFAPTLNHAQDGGGRAEYPEHDVLDNSEIKPLDAAALDFANGVFLRCERQALFRLPRSNAVVFTLRTYRTPLQQIRDCEPPENAANLVAAIRALPPATARYKLAASWGDAVISYLTRETDGKIV